MYATAITLMSVAERLAKSPVFFENCVTEIGKQFATNKSRLHLTGFTSGDDLCGWLHVIQLKRKYFQALLGLFITDFVDNVVEGDEVFAKLFQRDVSNESCCVDDQVLGLGSLDAVAFHLEPDTI